MYIPPHTQVQMALTDVLTVTIESELLTPPHETSHILLYLMPATSDAAAVLVYFYIINKMFQYNSHLTSVRVSIQAYQLLPCFFLHLMS